MGDFEKRTAFLDAYNCSRRREHGGDVDIFDVNRRCNRAKVVTYAKFVNHLRTNEFAEVYGRTLISCRGASIVEGLYFRITPEGVRRIEERVGKDAVPDKSPVRCYAKLTRRNAYIYLDEQIRDGNVRNACLQYGTEIIDALFGRVYARV